MGVRTAADEKLDEAREGVAKAIKSLSELVINECWGYDQFSSETLSMLHKSLVTLINIRNDLR